MFNRNFCIASALVITGCYSADGSFENLGVTNEKVIYGNDDRTEYVNITNARDRSLADATASGVGKSDVSCSGGTCSLTTTPYVDGCTQTQCLPLCQGTRFLGQGRMAIFGAVLVAPDLFLTAGHALNCPTSFGSCDPSYWQDRYLVFGFAADANGNAPTTVPESDVYSITSAQGAGVDINGNAPNGDFAVLKVDRIVASRIPVVVRYTGQVSNGTSLLNIGNTDGLPQKLSANSDVKASFANVFYANIDAFNNSSGSPVIGAGTGVLEGILVAGPENYVVNGTCMTPRLCSDTVNDCGWVESTTLPHIAGYAAIPLHAALISLLAL